MLASESMTRIAANDNVYYAKMAKNYSSYILVVRTRCNKAHRKQKKRENEKKNKKTNNKQQRNAETLCICVCESLQLGNITLSKITLAYFP